MYIKVFPHGKGSGQAAVNYLTRRDYPGRTENPPVVLRGEPELTQALIASQDRQWKFSAGVLSWGPEDHVTPEQEQRLMNDFEQTAFAGLALPGGKKTLTRCVMCTTGGKAGHNRMIQSVSGFVLQNMRIFMRHASSVVDRLSRRMNVPMPANSLQLSSCNVLKKEP